MDKIIILIFSFIFSLNLYSGTSANFLKINSDSKSLALGGNIVSLENGANSLYNNPATLNSVKKFEFSISHSFLLFENKLLQLAMAYNIKDLGSLAVGLKYLYIPEIEEYDLYGNLTGEKLKNSGMAVSLGYSKKILNLFALGIGLKYISQKLASEQSKSFGIDLGIHSSLTESISVGILLENIGSKLDFNNIKYSLPVNLKLGTDYLLSFPKSIINLIILNTGASLIEMKKFKFNLGTELNLKIIKEINSSIRLGIKLPSEVEFLDSLSYGLKLGYKSFIFEYGTQIYTSEIGQVNNVTFSMKF